MITSSEVELLNVTVTSSRDVILISVSSDLISWARGKENTKCLPSLPAEKQVYILR